MNTIVIIDPIRSGQKLIDASLKLGFNVLAVMTLSVNLLKHLNEYECCFIKKHNDSLKKVSLFTDSFQEVINYIEENNLKICAVIPATDPGIELADLLGEYFNVIHNEVITSHSRIDKGEMRKSVEHYGLKQPNYFVIDNIKQLDIIINSIKVPMIVKPPRSAGTNLVRVCKCYEDAKKAVKKILDCPNLFERKSESVIVEEYVFGQEYAVNLFAQSGVQYLIDIIKYKKYNNEYGNDIYYSAVQMTEQSQETSQLIQYAKNVANATGVKFGPSHVEIRMTKDGPQLMEIGCRFPGAKIPELWAESLSIDPFELTVQTFLGKTHELDDISFNKNYRIEFCSNDTYIENVNQIHGIDTIENLCSYHSHDLSIEINQKLIPTMDLATIPILIRLLNVNKNVLNMEADMCHKIFKIS